MSQSKEGRWARLVRQTEEVKANPRQIFTIIRAALVDVWRLRGGGFYGLGYLLAFCYFEVQMFLGEFTESDSVGSFALAQLLESLIRIGLLSFVNALQALFWPVYVLNLGGWLGILLLVGGYASFEYVLRPVVERAFPELREHRQAKEKKAEKQAQKKTKKKQIRKKRTPTE